MVLRKSVSAAAFAACFITAGVAQANQNYQVIPGIGPGVVPHNASAQRFAQQRPAQQRPAHVGHPSLNRAAEARASSAAPRQYASQQSPGAYGGGFIELLVTGRDPTPHAATINRPPPVDASYQRFRGSYGAPPPLVETAPRGAPARQAAIVPDAGLVSRNVSTRFERREIAYSSRHAPGTIIVDTPSRYLYLVMPNGRALRYGIGVGRPGFEWAGMKTVTRKAQWPDWRPPPEMLKRRPDLPRFMKGGPENPLGARALYLGSSLYRIHGTNEPWTIGQNVSSGCIRMMNDDVVDLYQRVRVGAKVVVI